MFFSQMSCVRLICHFFFLLLVSFFRTFVWIQMNVIYFVSLHRIHTSYDSSVSMHLMPINTLHQHVFLLIKINGVKDRSDHRATGRQRKCNSNSSFREKAQMKNGVCNQSTEFIEIVRMCHMCAPGRSHWRGCMHACITVSGDKSGVKHITPHRMPLHTGHNISYVWLAISRMW